MVMNISERRTRKERGRIRRVLVTPCLGGAYQGERDDEGIATMMEHARDSEDVWHAKQGKWCERCPGELEERRRTETKKRIGRRRRCCLSQYSGFSSTFLSCTASYAK